MNNLERFSRPISSKEIKRQIKEDIQEFEFRNENLDCLDGWFYKEDYLNSLSDKVQSLNFGLELKDSRDNEDNFYLHHSILDPDFDSVFLEIEEQDLLDTEVAMIKCSLMLNPAFSGLSHEELDAMALEEYRLCHEE